MPSILHEFVVFLLSRAFSTIMDDLPASVGSRIIVVTNLDFNCFEGRYWGTEKILDLAAMFDDTKGNSEAKFILEVGISETYDKLVREAKVWLEGKRNVSVVLLVKLEETPCYRDPLHDLNSRDFELLGFPKETDLMGSDFSATSDYGPVTYKGLVWVGEISTAFIEIWKRDPITGLATLDGNRIDLRTTAEPPRIEFQLSDFLDVAPEDERTIRFGWDNYQLKIRNKVIQQAVFRCGQALVGRAKAEGIGGSEYQPSSQGSSE